MSINCFSWSDILFGISMVLMAAGVTGAVLLDLKNDVEEWKIVLVFAIFVLSVVLMMLSLKCFANESVEGIRQLLEGIHAEGN